MTGWVGNDCSQSFVLMLAFFFLEIKHFPQLPDGFIHALPICHKQCLLHLFITFEFTSINILPKIRFDFFFKEMFWLTALCAQWKFV